MAIDREKICVGLVTRGGILSFEHIRKILFVYNTEEQTGYDLLNDVTYPALKSKARKDCYISNIINLDSILQPLGYPETLEDILIQKIIGEDFENVFMKSNVIKYLYSYEMENLSPIQYQNGFDNLREEFNIREDEKKVQNSYQKKKRRF